MGSTEDVVTMQLKILYQIIDYRGKGQNKMADDLQRKYDRITTEYNKAIRLCDTMLNAQVGINKYLAES